MKKDFYVFLDIDGVLWDWDFIDEQRKQGNPVAKGGIIAKFNPQSIKAVDSLLNGLKQKYNVQLVLSSTWRVKIDFAIETLIENGFKHCDGMHTTPITNHPSFRGKEILEYLQDKQQPYDFVVIDDEMYDFERCFDASHLIKTNIYTGSLKQSQVDAYLNEKIFDGAEL